MRNFLAGALIAALIIGLWYFFFLEPSGHRVWIEEQSRTTTVELDGDEVILRNVRDWTYDATGPLSKEWIDMAVDPDDIVRVWFVIEPFGKWKAVGHTFLTFEFKDGSTVAFSVEARREQGEDYHAFLGAFRAYDLTYQWGTERDLITRRLVALNHPMRMYPLVLPEGAGPALFRTLVGETNELAATPRFYNTLLANCTNILARIVNEHYPNTLPRHYSWILTGYSDTYLMREKFIEVIDESPEKTMARYDLTPVRESVGFAGELPPTAFSDVVRLLLETKQ